MGGIPVLGLLLVGLVAPSCGTPLICDPDQRTELIKADLVEWQPSPAFKLKEGSTGWIQVTRLPESAEGLFGTINGVAVVYSVHSGVAPKLTTDANGNVQPHDPSIIIDKGLTWQRLALGSGDWQLYAYSNPGIEVVSCPA